LTLFSQGVQYDDVRDAWQYYLKNDNQGRGVVLIGHSQGAFILQALVANEIDGKPVQKQLVGAYILGATFLTPKGKTWADSSSRSRSARNPARSVAS
jgi:pimeloyl-ACP methyl ester carboxylesterase